VEINSSFAQTPHPVITSMKVLGQEKNLKDSATIYLSSGENSISFEYAVPGIDSSRGLSYSYRLEGFDKDWVNAGNRQYVSYTNLYGGDYVFKLKVAVGEGGWYEMISPVKIHISKFFYNSAWFIILVALTIVMVTGLVIYFAYRAQLQRVLMTQKVRNSIASDLHDDIGSTLSSIMLMSEIAAKKPELATSYFSQISESAGKVIENMNDIVWAINPDNDELAQIVVRMKSFAASLLEKRYIALQFESSPGIDNLRLGMKERRNFYLIFKEAIHNAVKYSSCSIVKTTISAAGDMITLVIEDDGIGFDTEKNYMGNGLRNLHKRADEISGTLQLISAPGNETKITLSFKTTQTGG